MGELLPTAKSGLQSRDYRPSSQPERPFRVLVLQPRALQVQHRPPPHPRTVDRSSRTHLHTIATEGLAAQTVLKTINCHSALKTDTHSAKRRTWFTRNGPAKRRLSRTQYCRSDACSG